MPNMLQVIFNVENGGQLHFTLTLKIPDLWSFYELMSKNSPLVKNQHRYPKMELTIVFPIKNHL